MEEQSNSAASWNGLKIKKKKLIGREQWLNCGFFVEILFLASYKKSKIIIFDFWKK